MAAFKNPRIWLILWGGAGALALFYIIASASLKPKSSAQPSAIAHSAALLVGEMADFEYAFPPRGAPLAAFEHHGEAMTLADFRGKTVLVNFWATWCAPCLKELPSLDALQEKFADRKFEVIAIAADPRGPQAAQAFLDRLDIVNLKLYADPRLSVAMAYGGVDVLPVSILYDPQGREVGRIIGEADWTSPEAIALVGSAIP